MVVIRVLTSLNLSGAFLASELLCLASVVWNEGKDKLFSKIRGGLMVLHKVPTVQTIDLTGGGWAIHSGCSDGAPAAYRKQPLRLRHCPNPAHDILRPNPPRWHGGSGRTIAYNRLVSQCG
ncbi:hypothetical protein K505DRAFT_79337 [Melanomma pulvis-pyrius CBS 109.77]|uniref:Secreted protein n=1 Tax=Melanomma pulvis-pyrius CBS 109.77 TaxID=1314802 RepID=A0A6A6X3J5_9PLEO|nr:hypothetical protein K505DRAFT_79337 [Melanomma pulvis-pyrius CBS 109.77]